MSMLSARTREVAEAAMMPAKKLMNVRIFPPPYLPAF
jgi:hypothetical protein